MGAVAGRPLGWMSLSSLPALSLFIKLLLILYLASIGAILLLYYIFCYLILQPKAASPVLLTHIPIRQE